MRKRNTAQRVDVSSRDVASEIAASPRYPQALRALSTSAGNGPTDSQRRTSRLHDAPSGLAAGRGLLEFSVVAGRSTATRVAAASPLKFLTPRRGGPASWVYACTFGGGLVAGDKIDVQARLGPRVTAVLSTQSSTKVYKSVAGRCCRQSLWASVADEATLILVPDPLVCFAGARYEQVQEIHLAPSAALVVVDCLTSGRHARGERWAFARYHSRLSVFMAGELLLADRLLLDAADGPLTSPYRLGRFNCLALVGLFGRQFKEVCASLVAEHAAQPVSQRSSIVAVASPIQHGIILRILGQHPQQVLQLVRESLAFLERSLGDAPWARKW